MQHLLKIVLGTNYFSLSELAHITTGDLIVTTALTGKPQILYWNNQPVAMGEIIIIENYFAFRVSYLTVDYTEKIYPGLKKQLIDTIKGEVILSQKNAASEDLLKIKEGSIIYFGDNINDDFKFYISDQEIAQGKVAVIEENIALSVTSANRLKNIDCKSYPYKSTGNILKKDQDNLKYKFYDFRRPEKFSYKQITNLFKVHNRLINNTIFNSNKSINLQVTAVDQLTFKEFWQSIQKNYKIDLYKFFNGKTTKKTGNLIQIKGAVNKLKNNQLEDLNNFFSSCQENTMNFLVVSDSDNSITNQNIFEISFKKAWEFISHNEPILVKKDTPLNEAKKILPDNDMVCIVEVSYQENDKEGKTIILYPYVTIENMLPALEEAVF